MKRSPVLPAFGFLLHAAVAGAHVKYHDLDSAPLPISTTYGGAAMSDPCAGRVSGCQSSNAFTRYGWLKGTESTLGNSHFLTLNAEFWRFHLEEGATVRIAFTQGQAGIDPAFSLYSGLLPNSGHDDVPVDPLNPVGSDGCAVASPKDARGGTDAYTDHDGYRDTLTFSTTGGLDGCLPKNSYFGQFDAFASWSMANPSGTWSRVRYVSSVSAAPFAGNDGGSHVDGNHLTAAGTGESLTIALEPGDYTIAAGGEACSTSTGPCSAILYGTVSYERVFDGGTTAPTDGGGVTEPDSREAGAGGPGAGGEGGSGGLRGDSGTGDAGAAPRDGNGSGPAASHASGGCTCNVGAERGGAWGLPAIAMFIFVASGRRRAWFASRH